MKTAKLSFLLLAGLLLTTFSCEKEQFNKEAYDDLVAYRFLVDSMDKAHDWCLTYSDTVTIVNQSADIYAVEVLTQNPYLSDGAEIASAGICPQNSQIALAYTLPSTQRQAYIAAKRQDGSYLGVVSFTVGTDIVNLNAEAIQTVGTVKSVTPQTFTFLYEGGFPVPGDFDYNDMVLRVSKRIADDASYIDLKVTLEAVGIRIPYAAAIHLADVKYADIEKVEILEGKPMDEDYPLKRMTITSDKTLLKGRHSEAVINLFESAHYVLNHELDEVGSIQTLLYNTAGEREEYSTTAPSVSRTYRIFFKDSQVARNLTFDRIDPFLIQEYNSGLWEIHTYRYKFAEVLKSIYNGKQHLYDNHVSWSLVVPKGDFRYPVEGMSLGTYNSVIGEFFGPYTSFADWIMDHTQALDWYEHPTYTQLLY